MSPTNDDSPHAPSQKLYPLPDSFRAIEIEAALAKEEEQARALVYARQEPVVDAFRRIYERIDFVFGEDTSADRKWFGRYAQRIVDFGCAATNAGYADSVRALNYDLNLRKATDDAFTASSTKLAIDLLKEGLNGDVDRIEMLLLRFPIDPSRLQSARWDLPFHDGRLLNAILEPGQDNTSVAVESQDKIEIETDSTLTDRDQWILKALFELAAFDHEHRKSTAKVVAKAAGGQADPGQYKEVVSDLKTRGLVDTKEGRGGGIWLTARGCKHAEKL